VKKKRASIKNNLIQQLKESKMVPVYETEMCGKVVARVNYNQNLDVWNGRNWNCGSTGRHEGLTKLRDGRFVLIQGSDWQNESSFGSVITAEEALQRVLSTHNEELLDLPRFKVLKELAEATIAAESDDEAMEEVENGS